MLDLWPVPLEIEIGAVVQVVAFHTHFHNTTWFEDLAFHVSLVVDNLQTKFFPECFQLFILHVDIAVFGQTLV